MNHGPSGFITSSWLSWVYGIGGIPKSLPIFAYFEGIAIKDLQSKAPILYHHPICKHLGSQDNTTLFLFLLPILVRMTRGWARLGRTRPRFKNSVIPVPTQPSRNRGWVGTRTAFLVLRPVHESTYFVLFYLTESRLGRVTLVKAESSQNFI